MLTFNLIRLGFGIETAIAFMKGFGGLPPQTRNMFIEEIKRMWNEPWGDVFVIRDYPILMKGLGTVKCHVVNPYLAYGLKELPMVLTQYRNAMQGNDLSVILKRQQTGQFLQTAVAIMDPVLKHLGALMLRMQLR